MLEIFTIFADFTTYQMLGIKPETPWAEAIHFFVLNLTKLYFLLAALTFLIGFLRSWLSPVKIRRWLDGKPIALAYILAVILGAITPFCSCSSVPLFIAFLSTGIPLGVTMSFLITSPMINEVAAILFGEALGWPFTFAYVAVGMGTGLVGGLLVDALKLGKWVEPFAFEQTPSESDSTTSLSLKSRLFGAWAETKHILANIWIYIVLGVAVGAGIYGFVPQEFFLEYAGPDRLFAVPAAVIAAIPLYSSVTGTIPVAEALLAKGLPVGTTLAFIMSTVAISLPELMILRRMLKPQMLVFFVIYLTLAFTTVGYAFNWLY